MKTNRRSFLETSLKAAALTSAGVPFIAANIRCTNKKQSGKTDTETSGSGVFQFSQNKLPYDYASLEPSIDALTMEIHYTRHHSAYVKNVNEAITAGNVSYQSEEDFLKNMSRLSAKIRNNAGGAWNHNFFWTVMKPGGGAPAGKILDAINGVFGGFDKFREQFTQAAMSRFGSGWAWLVDDGGKLKIGSTPNQDNPLMDLSELKGRPVLAIDVWEHAYYLKYQNKRNDYIANWWNVVNWDEVSKRLG